MDMVRAPSRFRPKRASRLPRLKCMKGHALNFRTHNLLIGLPTEHGEFKNWYPVGEMADRREILDSDDDEDDYSPVKDTANSVLPGDIIYNTANALETGSSTDPSFFKSVYDEQQTVAGDLMPPPDRLSHNNSIENGDANFDMSPASTARSRRQAHEDQNSSSMTDPRHRKSRRGERKDVIDLTQVTTPGRVRSSGPSDLWDVPSSPVAQMGQSGGPEDDSYVTDHRGKRKREETSNPWRAVDDGGSARSVSEAVDSSSSKPAKKKTKREARTSLSQPSQEVDLVMVPGTGDEHGEYPPNGNSDHISASVVKDTLDKTGSASLYVAQSVLTASQKQQYELVDPSSAAERDYGEGYLLRPEGMAGFAHTSSGATTIAYPTPTQFASSAPRAEATVESSSATRRRRGRAESSLPVPVCVFFAQI